MNRTTHLECARHQELDYQPHRLRMTGCGELQPLSLDVVIEEKVGSKVSVPMVTVTENIEVDIESVDYSFS